MRDRKIPRARECHHRAAICLALALWGLAGQPTMVVRGPGLRMAGPRDDELAHAGAMGGSGGVGHLAVVSRRYLRLSITYQAGMADALGAT